MDLGKYFTYLVMLYVDYTLTQSVRGMSMEPRQIRHNLTEITKIRKIKQEIMDRLGKTAPPTEPPPSEKNIVYLLLRDNVAEESTQREVSQILSFSEAPEKFEDEKIIQFRFTKDIEGRRLIVKSASLWIRVKQRRRRPNKKVKLLMTERQFKKLRKRRRRKGSKVSLSVFTVSNAGEPGDSLAAVKIRIKRNKWFKLNLNSTHFQDVVDSSNGTVLLYVQCKGCKKNTRVVLVNSGRRRKRQLKKSKLKKTKNLKLKKDRPFIILQTFIESRNKESGADIERKKRIRRNVSRDSVARTDATGFSSCRIGNTRCCKRQLYVDFREIGWGDWIIAPRGFTTAECLGGCPHNNSIEGAPSDCEPTMRGDLRLVYQESRGVYIGSTMPDFIVTKCGCVLRDHPEDFRDHREI